MNSYAVTKREFLSIVFKKKVPILVAFVSIFLIVTAYSYVISPSYEANAKVLIKSGREFLTHSEAGAPQGTSPYLTKQEIINSELEILTSNDLIEGVINKIGLDKVYPKIAAHPPSNMRPIDKAIDAFTHDLKVQSAAMSEVIDLTYYNEDREVAIQVLSTLIQLYQTKHASIFGNNKSSFFDQEMSGYNDKLNALTRQITDIRQASSLFDVTAQRAQLIQDRAAIADSLRNVQSRSVNAHGLITYYGGKLKELQPLVIEGDAPGDSVETAKSKLLDLTTQLQGLQQRYSTDVKPIRDIKEQIGSVKAFIDGTSVSNHRTWMQRNPLYDDADLKLQQAEADAASTDAQARLQQKNLDDVDAKLRSLEEGARTLEALERDHTMLDDLARQTRTRYEDAHSDEELDKADVVSVSVLEQPDASTKPAKPKHSVYALIGLALGFVGAGAIVLYTVMFRETVITAESVERLLRVKVLCVVPLQPGTL